MSESANDVRMPDAIESYSLVLKILDKRPLEIRVEVILQENVQGLYHDEIVRRIRRGKDIPGQKDLGVASLPKPLLNVVSFVQP